MTRAKYERQVKRGQESTVLASLGADVQGHVEQMAATLGKKGKTFEQGVFEEAAKRLGEAVAMNTELEKLLPEKKIS